MSFATPAAFWLLGLMAPIVALHVLRSRRVEVVVSSTLAWQAVDRPVAAARPWQRLRWSIPLVLQLLLVALLASALAGPALDTGRVSAQHLVVLLDTSASMGATDGAPTRLSSARDEVDRLTGELGEGAVVSVIATGAPARVVASSVAPDSVGARLESVDVSEGPFDAEAASSLALGMDRPDRSVAYALVSDGGLDASDVRFLPAGTEFHPVGRRDRNLGVTNVVVSSAGDQTHLQVSISNSGEDPATSIVRVDVDRADAASTSVTVPGGETTEIGFDVPSGDRIEVHLDIDDLLSSDNHVDAVGPAARTLGVLRVGAANPFLDALLDTRASFDVTQVASIEELGTDPGALDRFDVAIFDRTPVPAGIRVPWLGIASPGGAPGVAVDGDVDTPVPALVRADSDLLAGLDLGELAFASAQRIDAPAATTQIGAEDTPLVVQGTDDGIAFVYLGFALDQSNLGLLPAFPVLADRILDSLGGADLAAGSLTVGDQLPVDPGSEAVVTAPSGTRTDLSKGNPAPLLDRIGVWTIDTAGGPEAGGQRRLAVVTPAPAESDVAPRDGLAIPGVADPGGAGGAPVRRSLMVALLLTACAVLGAEWWFSARRRGVGRRQWRIAQVVRAGVLVAIILALLAPTFSVSSSKVAAVIVVDVSDSMAGGRDRAVDTVRTAIDQMPDGDAVGVVAVGGDARVDAAVEESLDWNGVGVRLDGSATDLAAGVRVAGAMLPDDRARRVVVVSDGRPTTGDLEAEISRLRRVGVRMDTIPIDTSTGPDVLVASIEVPDRARPSDDVAITVRLRATEAQRVSVTLRRDDVEVETRLVDAAAGETEVEFSQPAGEPATVRWTASVAGPSNGILENDLARASTRIEGRAQVLVVEGAPDESAALGAVFAATGAAVTTIAPEGMTSLTDLSANDAVVLVDVPLTALSPDQVDLITTATRELGTGLLTIGGTSSYGAGEYLGSPLEALLPVLSEVRDPKRRSKVAQVFAVDVSGSMGACHCADDAGGDNSRLPGGIEKADIARNAAVRALDGIEPTDELGVLALDDQHRWIRDLGPVGNGSEARDELGSIKQSKGGTNLEPGLSVSAERLRESDASLRHIVLFTDGFEDTNTLARLAGEAGELRADGITVSVMGTGEGAAGELRRIADSGGGRYYPGRDLNDLPNLLLQETQVVSRQLIVEGDFTPERTSSAPIVDRLDVAPPLGGYIATTARPTATTHLRVGDEQDPLLASWQIGLGRVTSWTSDAGNRWAGGWTAWEGAPAFWADVLRSVYREPQGSLAVRFDDAEATATATFDSSVPDGANVSAVVVGPDGRSSETAMRRIDDRTFDTTFPTERIGAYALNVTATEGNEALASVTGVAQLGYSREYSGAPADPELLTTASLRSGGRGSITAADVFAPDGLERGRRVVDLRAWWLLLALLAWPIAIALSRLRFATGPDAKVRSERLGRIGSVGDLIAAARTAGQRSPTSERPVTPNVQQTPTATPKVQASESPTVDRASPPPSAPSAGVGVGSPRSNTSPSPGRPGEAPPDPPSPAPGSSLDALLAAKRSRRRLDVRDD